MPEATSGKTAQTATTRKTQNRPLTQGQSQSAGPSRDLEQLQNRIGNRAATGLFQKNRQTPNPEAGNGAISSMLHSPPAAEPAGSSRPLRPDERRTIERASGPLPDIALHEDDPAQEFTSRHNAHAAARGRQIVAEQDAFEGTDGRLRLAHEVGHILQQRIVGLPSGSTDQLEADASQFAHTVASGRPSAVNFSAPHSWLFDLKDFKRGDQVVSLVVSKAKSGKGTVSITMKGQSGGKLYRLSYTLERADIATGKTYDGSKTDKGLQVKLAGAGYLIYFSGTPDPNILKFPATFPVTVVEGAEQRGGGGDGKGKGSGSGGDKGAGAKSGGDKPGGGTTPPPGAPGQTGTDKSAPPTTGTPPESATTPPPEAKVPVIQVTDLSQIEKLKAKGLIPAKSADEIKAKLEKQQALTFEEALALIEGLDKVSEPPDPAKKDQGRDSWLKWAQFVKDNKDKISGRAKNGGENALTVDEVKEIIDKHNEFVGTSGADPSAKDPRKPYDPEKSKAWNDLPTWQKDIWKEYSKKYGSKQDEPGRADPTLTGSDLFSMALNMSPQYMPAGARAAAIHMFHDPIFLVGTVVSISLYVAAWVFPEPIFSKATAATITIALLAVFAISEIRNFALAWMRLSDESGQSRTMDELEDAAKHFGESVGGIGIRVLITIATIIAGKSLPAPKPGAGGGGSFGGPEPAPVGGPPGILKAPAPAAAAAAAEDAGVAIKVLKDGTIVVLGPGAGAVSQSAQAGGPGSGSLPASPPAPAAPKPAEGPAGSQASEPVSPEAAGQPELPEVKKLPTGGKPPTQKISVQSTPPKGFEDIFEQEGISTRRTPGGKQPPQSTETGNFAHKYFEQLEGLLKQNANSLVSEKLPPNAEAEYPIKLKDTPNPPRIDRLDRAGETVIEIKPKSLRAQGEVEARDYADKMDRSEPLPGGRKWKWKVVTYDFDKVIAFLRKIGYFEPKK
jgi:hypothetical protein